MASQKSHAEDVSKIRSEIIKLALAAVVLAGGIELFTAPVLGVASWPAAAVAASGVALVLAAMAYLIRDAIKGANISLNIRAILFLDTKDFSLIEAERYHFSCEASRYLKGLFAENKAYGKTWSRDAGRKKDINTGPVKPDEKIVLELFEYYFLKQLSLHLSEVFESGSGADVSRITKFNREDIPQILLTNRFLESFSKDMSARDAFSENRGGVSVVNGDKVEVLSAYGKGGAIYDRFRLILPKNSKLLRDDTGCIIIDTPKFVLSASSSFYGFHTNAPLGFEPLYLGREWDDTETMLLPCKVSLKFKLSSIMAPGGWEYFSWVEDFVRNIESRVSFASFLDEIGWNQAFTTVWLMSEHKSIRAIINSQKSTERLGPKRSADTAKSSPPPPRRQP